MDQTALLVMEMQTDYLREKRIAKFTYDTNELVPAVNAAIAEYAAQGCDIVYLRQIFPDTPSNHLIFGFNIEGTPGAELWNGLDVVSAHIFDKNIANVFSDGKIGAFLRSQGYSEYLLCGIDECGSIAETALGAAAAGAKAAILRDACATRFDFRKQNETRAKLKQRGVAYI